MKKFMSLFLLVGLFAVSAFAQSAPNVGGEWTLDKSKSTLDERMARSIESQTMTVTQTATDVKVATVTKRNAPPAGAPGGGQGGGMGGQGGGGRGMGGGMGGDTTNTYTLDGKEVTVEVEGPMGKVPVKFKGEIKNGALHVQTTRTFNGPQGEITTTTKETWTVSADGKTLTVKRDTESPRGTQSSELVFSKKS